MNLGTAIRTVRKSSGLRQKEICEALHITPNFASMVERNKRTMSLQKLEVLASLLKIPVSFFYVLAEQTDNPDVLALKKIVQRSLSQSNLTDTG